MIPKGKNALKIMLFLFCMNSLLQAADKPKLVMQPNSSRKMADQVAELAIILEPTLPAPALIPEPDFTVGQSNTIYWNADSVKTLCAALNYDLLYFEVQAQFGDEVLYSPVQAHANKATFEAGLPEGVNIAYTLRYFAQHQSDGTYAMSAWSEPEISMQDIHQPIIDPDSSRIINCELSGDKYWLFGKSVELRVLASDLGEGKIGQVCIYENSETATDSLSYDFDIPDTRKDSTIVFSLKSDYRIPVFLEWKVVDLSGQHSESMSATIYAWPKEDSQEKSLICFPNPFRPGMGEMASIKTDADHVTKIRIFDLFGNQIVVLSKSEQEKYVEWDGRNNDGKLVAQGGYLCVVQGKENLYCKIAVIR